MAKFRVVEEFEVEGTVKSVGLEIELTDEQAQELGSKVEALVDEEKKEGEPVSGAVASSTSGEASTSGESTSGSSTSGEASA